MMTYVSTWTSAPLQGASLLFFWSGALALLFLTGQRLIRASIGIFEAAKNVKIEF